MGKNYTNFLTLFFCIPELRAVARPRPASARQSVLLVLTPSSGVGRPGTNTHLPPATTVDLQLPPPPPLRSSYAIAFSLSAHEAAEVSERLSSSRQHSPAGPSHDDCFAAPTSRLPLKSPLVLKPLGLAPKWALF